MNFNKPQMLFDKMRLYIAASALLLLPGTGLRAEGTNYYLPANRLDPVALLVPPPLPDSGEQAGDLAEVRFVHANHSTNDETAAWVEARGISPANFKAVLGDAFDPAKLPKTGAFFHRLAADCESQVNPVKQYWNRKRPYVLDSSLAQGKPVAGGSYPSGHSTLGMTYALVLAEIFPNKRDELLAVGRSIGWHRVMIAKHYPTDVFAGRALAQAIVREMNTCPDFQHDLAEVKAEITAAELKNTSSDRLNLKNEK